MSTTFSIRALRIRELALRFILAEPTVSTVIPGDAENRPCGSEPRAANDGEPLSTGIVQALRTHSYDTTILPVSAPEQVGLDDVWKMIRLWVGSM